MNDIQKNKVTKFINDEVMQSSVYEVIQDAFLNRKGQKDVHILAGERLALDYLNEAWRELERFKQVNEEKSTVEGNVGL